MTEEEAAPKGVAEIPDAYLILHRNADTRFGINGCYALGPYPPFRELAEFLMNVTECDCTKTVVPCYFPNGVTMAASAPDTLPVMPLPGLDGNN